jgi:hypothetical protein
MVAYLHSSVNILENFDTSPWKCSKNDIKRAFLSFRDKRFSLEFWAIGDRKGKNTPFSALSVPNATWLEWFCRKRDYLGLVGFAGSGLFCRFGL